VDKLERDRDKLRYPSDLTDAEWQLIKALIPPAKRGGGKRTGKMRDVCAEHRRQRRYIPKDLPPRGTVNGCFCLGAGTARCRRSITRST